MSDTGRESDQSGYTVKFDQYDIFLRNCEPGLLLSVNDSIDSASGTPEMCVKRSRDNPTDVYLEGVDGSEYTITRDSSGELIVKRYTNDSWSYVCSVNTIEVIGVKPGKASYF